MSAQASEWNEDDLEIRARLRELWAFRWWLALSIIVTTVVFVGASFLITPVYRSSVVLVPATPDSGAGGTLGSLGQIGGLAAMAGLSLGNGSGELEESLAVLRSRQFTESFIRDENLLPVLYPKHWDAANKQWTVSEDHQPTYAEAYKRFDTRVRTILQDKKTGLVTIRIEWTDRMAAAAWANKLVRRLNEEMRGRARLQADASMGFLKEELANTTDVSTRDAVGRLIEAQVKQRMIANVTPEFAFRIVDKALPADAKDPERPKKILFLLMGPVAGVAIGIFFMLAIKFLRKPATAA